VYAARARKWKNRLKEMPGSFVSVPTSKRRPNHARQPASPVAVVLPAYIYVMCRSPCAPLIVLCRQPSWRSWDPAGTIRPGPPVEESAGCNPCTITSRRRPSWAVRPRPPCSGTRRFFTRGRSDDLAVFDARLQP